MQLVQPLFEGKAFQKWHGNVGDAALFIDLINGNEVIMLELGSGPRLAHEPVLRSGLACETGQHRFQGDGALQAGILGKEDNAHSSTSENFQHAIGPETAQLVGVLGGSEEVERFCALCPAFITRRNGANGRCQRW